MKTIAHLYRLGFGLALAALLLFVFGETLPGSAELKASLALWAAIAGSALLLAAGVVDAFRRRDRQGGPC